MGIVFVLKQCKILRKKLAKEKTLRQQQAAGGDTTKIKATDLTILLSWHQHPKVCVCFDLRLRMSYCYC